MDDDARELPRVRPGQHPAVRRRVAPENVGSIERMVSTLGGGLLAAYAVRRRGVAGATLGVVGGALLHRGLTGRCAVYRALEIDTADALAGPESNGLARMHGPSAVLDASKAIRVERSVTIDAEPDEIFHFWRDFENLPLVMRHLDSVEVLDSRRSRWRAKAPAGQTVEWDAEIYNEIPSRLIAWRSVGDATVPNAGSVRFTPAADGRGTDVRVLLEYDPPGGRFGSFVAKMFGEDPSTQVRDDLRRLKRLLERATLKGRA